MNIEHGSMKAQLPDLKMIQFGGQLTLRVPGLNQAKKLHLAGFLPRFHPCLPSSPSVLPNASACLSGYS